MKTKIDALIERLMDAGAASAPTLRGCTSEEIQTLEKELGVSLPATYREYLEKIGRQAGVLFQGSDFSYSILPTLRAWADELLLDNHEPIGLPEGAFVFLMHQGYMFVYFDTSGGEDPPVYQYSEVNDRPNPSEVAPSFTEYLRAAVDSHIEALPAMLSFGPLKIQ